MKKAIGTAFKGLWLPGSAAYILLITLAWQQAINFSNGLAAILLLCAICCGGYALGDRMLAKPVQQTEEPEPVRHDINFDDIKIRPAKRKRIKDVKKEHALRELHERGYFLDDED